MSTHTRRHSLSILAMFCLLAAVCLAGCTTAPPTQPHPISLTPPAGLSIEEHPLQSAPTGEPLDFKPLNGSMEEILARRQPERDYEALLLRRNNQLLEPFGYQIDTQSFPYQLLKDGSPLLEIYDFGPVTLNTAGEDFLLPVSASPDQLMIRRDSMEKSDWPNNSFPAFLGDRLVQVNSDLLGLDPATPKANQKSQWRWLVQVTLDQTAVYSATLFSPVTVPAIWGLQTVAGHWVLETYGDLIQDGESLSSLYGYDQTFGFQLLAGEPFFFFQKGKSYGVFYAGQEIPLDYDWLPHYGCCSASEFNPRHSENMLSFFAKRADVYYYVEIGVFEASK